jgi:hypothetical protein
MPSYLPKGNSSPGLRRAELAATGPVEIGVVFDRWSSMASVASAAVAGFNVLLDEQKKLDVPARFSLSFFSDTVVSVHDGVPVNNVGVMEGADYRPRGNTALHDGIGIMIEAIGARVDPSPHPSRALIAILTDGMENSLTRFTKEEIFAQISFRRTACNWQFLFMGVGGQTVQTGLSLGIQRSNIIEFGADPAGVTNVMLALSRTVRAYALGDKNYALLLKG